MITKVFKFLGHGDTMIGMQYSAYGFMAIILLIVISCSIIFTLNFMEERKRMNVSLKSKQAEKKKEENKYGMFNYTIINGENSSVNDDDVDITDPKNRSGNNSNNTSNGGKHRHHKKRNGLKEVPTRLVVENNAPKVSLINKDGHIESSISQNANSNASTDNSFSNDFTFSNNNNNDFQVPEQVASFDASEFDDSSIEIINTNPVPPQPQLSNNMEDGMMPQPEIIGQNNSENLNIPATVNMNDQNNTNQTQVQQQLNTPVNNYPRNNQSRISDNPFDNFINPNRLSK